MAVNPYLSPTETAERPIHASTPANGRWVGRAWDVALLSVFLWAAPAMFRNTISLLTQPSLDPITTAAKIPERWILGFFLLAFSYFLAKPRGAGVQVLYGLLVVSFLLQHRMDVGDIVTASVVAIVFAPVLLKGTGWMGVLHVLVRRASGIARQAHR